MNNLKISILFFLSLIFVFYSFNLFEEKPKLTLNQNPFEIKDLETFSRLSNWDDYSETSYQDTSKIYKEDYYSSTLFKNSIQPKSWSDLYLKISNADKEKLDLITDMLFSIKIENNLNSDKFAKLIVSYVQHIPYSLLVGKTCKEAARNESVRMMLENGINCEENIYAGIYSPMEFIKNYKGDCDTRTVFLYTLMKNIGYDVVIMNSKYYKHSILGIRLASSGKYKKFRGQKYYVWETTNVGWRIGSLPAQYSKLDKWNIIL
tara:strand:+ start:1787 stop:2572 length:786 start_codon:yes stop_codon:yes gene_type:complete